MKRRALELVLGIITASSLSCSGPHQGVAPYPTTQSTPAARARVEGSTPAPAQPPAEAVQQRPVVVKPTPAPVEPSPGSLAYLDFKNGFRDLKFGDPPAADMVLKEDSGDSKFYVRPQDELGIGGATVNRIAYGFYKERLSSILIETKGLTNSRGLLDVLRQAYGIGEQPNRFMNSYTWRGSRAIVSYDENSITHNATVWFFSAPLISEEQADKKAKARKGVSGL
jgi:hypothetical protein